MDEHHAPPVVVNVYYNVDLTPLTSRLDAIAATQQTLVATVAKLIDQNDDKKALEQLTVDVNANAAALAAATPKE